MEGARKLMGGVLVAVAGAAKHAVWYVRYQVEGHTRDGNDEPPADEKRD